MLNGCRRLQCAPPAPFSRAVAKTPPLKISRLNFRATFSVGRLGSVETWSEAKPIIGDRESFFLETSVTSGVCRAEQGKLPSAVSSDRRRVAEELPL